MSKHATRVFQISMLLLALSVLLSLYTGRFTIVLSEIVSGETASSMVFFNLRLPRTVMAVLSGAALGLSGAVFQTVFRNRLASPDVIGVAAGANMGAAFAILLTGGTALFISLFALLGGMLAVLAAMLIASTARREGTATFVIAGVMVNSVTQAVIMLLKLTADPERQLAAMEYWAMGSLASITLDKLYLSVPLILLGMGAMLLLRWNTTMLSLSDQEATALGVHPVKARIMVLFFATLAVAASVSVTGLISFIGLIAPYIARLLLKGEERGIYLLSPLLGAVLLTVSDCLARSIAKTEVPISVLTSLLSSPVLLYLLYRREKVTQEW